MFQGTDLEKVQPIGGVVAALESLHQSGDMRLSDVGMLLLLESDGVVKAIASYLEGKNIPGVTYYSQGGQSILFTPPDKDIVIRVGHRSVEGEGTDIFSDKKLRPLDSVELDGGFLLKVYPFLPEKGSNRHTNILREALAAQDGIDFHDAKPDNIRLLPDAKRTPVVSDDGAVQMGQSAAFQKFSAVVCSKTFDYDWRGLQETLFKPLMEKYNLPGVSMAERATPQGDKGEREKVQLSEPSWRDDFKQKKQKKRGRQSSVDDWDDDGSDDGSFRRGGGGRRERF